MGGLEEGDGGVEAAAIEVGPGGGGFSLVAPGVGDAEVKIIIKTNFVLLPKL